MGLSSMRSRRLSQLQVLKDLKASSDEERTSSQEAEDEGSSKARPSGGKK